MLSIFLKLIEIVFVFYLSLFFGTWIIFMLMKSYSINTPISILLNNLNIVDNKLKFWFKQLVINSIPFVLLGFVLKIMFSSFIVSGFQMIIILFSLPYSFYLAFSYFYSGEVFIKNIRDFFQFNNEHIEDRNLLSKIRNKNLISELNYLKGSPKNKIKKYILKNV